MRFLSLHTSPLSAILLLCLCNILFGCSGKPRDVIPENRFVDLMADMQLAEAYADNNPDGRDIMTRRNELAKRVMSGYGVTQDEIDSTLLWYGKNIDKYSELYEKVDKRISEKRAAMEKDSKPMQEISGDDLWPYSRHGFITNLGANDGWILSIKHPDIQKGDRLIWTMKPGNMTNNYNGVLGVEYEDGSSEAVNFSNSMSNILELALQTDTGKIVERIYGTILLKSKPDRPVFVDSIALRHTPYDSLEYSRYRYQRKYGIMIPSKKEKKDTVESIEKRDSLDSEKKMIRQNPKLNSDEVSRSKT